LLKEFLLRHLKPLLTASVRATLLFLFLSGFSTRPTLAAPVDDLQSAFEHPPDDSRIMVRWWWFGPAVTTQELEREMQMMKQGGIGGFEVQPVYPLALDDEDTNIKTLPFLSGEFLNALRFTSEKAREMGLRFDLTLGSGWPYGGPTVPVGDAAGRLRYEHVKIAQGSRRVPLPSIGSGERLIAVFLAPVEEGSIKSTKTRETTDIRDGAVELPANLEGPHELLFFISSHTGMQVKRPAVGAEGFVLDHFDKRAVDHYLETVGERLMQPVGASPPHAIFCDSLEVYGADWTTDFLDEFKKRRGYDLKPFLPALVSDVGPQTRELRHDWGETLTELLNERFLSTVRDWAKKHNTLFRVQNYGSPAAVISGYAHADLPEGEGAQWRTLSATRWASSASHIYGHQLTSSETWTWLHSPAFRATPLDMKAEADRHFLEGINQLVGHGWPYTSPSVDYPGWRFYAAAALSDKNPWWIVMPDLTSYLQRISFILRQGQPSNDIAVYLSNDDAWASFTPGNVNLVEIMRGLLGPDLIPQALKAGYGMDFFDGDSFSQVGRADKGTLVLGKNRYKVVVLPNVERIPLETYRKLQEFSNEGGTLIATKRTPALEPGYLASQKNNGAIREISKRLFDGPGAHGQFVENERDQLGATLARSLQPDVALSPAAPEVGFIHRTTPDAEIYFLANTSNVRQHATATFRQSLNPEWWDPFTGRVTAAQVVEMERPSKAVLLDLEPYTSRVLVFSKRKLPPALPDPTVLSTIDISTGWRVSFGRDTGQVSMEALRSWTDDENTRYFSGAATYEKEFNAPENIARAGVAVRLNLGDARPVPEETLRAGMQAWIDPPVREAAVVYLNDEKAGTVWSPPYSVDLTGLLHRGANKIRIVVANTAINYMAGHALPDYRLLNLRYGERFQAQDIDKVRPLPSGLLGPIRLIVSRTH